MDGFSAVASVAAVIQIAAEVAKLCGGYLHDVKHARQDIERMKAKTLALHDVLERLNNTSESNIDRAAIQQCFQDLKSLREKLEPKKKNHAATKHFWARALKWPFSSKEANETMTALEGYLTIFNMALQINISDKVSDAEQERIFERLAVAADAPFDSYENQRHRPCLEKTRVGILQQIMQWATKPSSQCIFWLKGMAGTGKSTVAITVASQLQKSSRSSASYFFKRGVGDLAHARKLIPTLVYQLAKESPSLCREVMLALKREPSLGHTASLREQYYKLFIDPVRKSQSCVQRKDPFILVIDALDECEEQQDVGLLLHLVAQTDQISAIHFRIFVTSRPDKRIRRGFGDMPNILYQSLVLHNEPRSNVDKDIELFLRKELEKVGRDQDLPLEWPADSKIQTLVEKAAGLFIFASTACHYIGDSPQALPEERLDQICDSITTTHNMNQEMDQMYTLILQNSIQGSFTDEEQARFHRVVGTIVMLFSPLSIPELHKLLYNSQPEGGRLVKHSLWSLHAVFNVPESSDRPVQPLHLSFRDFLLDGDRCLDRRFWIDERHVHNELAIDCIRLLSTSLHRDMCRLPSLGTLKSEIAQKDIENALSPAVQYACRYWTDHVEKGKLELPDYGCAHELLLQHFLHWLEAMSLMGNFSEAIIAITNMTAMINSQKSPIMYDLIHDCRRFLLAFRQAITDAPKQIYASALFFSPSHSTVRKIFSDVVPQWVKFGSLHREQWSSNLQTLEGHSDWVNCVVFSPDGQLMASGSDDHTVRLWNTQTGECRSPLEGHSGSVSDVAFSPDGQLMASGSEDHTVRLWNTQTGECCSLLIGHSGSVSDVVFSPDGQLMASGSYDHTVRLWNTQTGKCRSLLIGHSGPINNVIFSPDGQLVASGSEDEVVRLWDAQTGKCRSLLKGHSGWINNVVFSPDSQLVASGSDDQTVRLWDVQSGLCHSLLEGHSHRVSSVAFSPDGHLMASGSDDHIPRLWDVQTGKCRSLLEGHSGLVLDVVFSPDGQLMASGSDDHTVRLWNTQTGECRSLLEGHSSWVLDIAFSPDGQLVASGSDDHTVRLWNTQTGECGSLLEGHFGPVKDVVFSPDGQLVASASDDFTVRLWDAQTDECRSLPEGHSSWVVDVVFSPDGRLVASGSYDHTIRLWDVRTSKCCYLFEGHSQSVRHVIFSPDGQLVASGSDDQTVRLWDVQSGLCHSLLEGHSHSVSRVAFSPDGQMMASGSGDGTVRLWEAQTGECRSPLEGHSGSVSDVAFSPDGQLMASGSEDHTVRLWNTQTGECCSLLIGHSGSVSDVVFSPDGQLIASGSHDHTVRLWNTQTGECRSLLEGHSSSVENVVFSPDGQLVASGSWDLTVRLWDVQTGNHVSTIPCSSPRPQIEFHAGLGLISADGATFEILSAEMTKALADDPRGPTSTLEIYATKDWVVKSSERVLWLPPDYRPTSYNSYGNTIVLGLSSGKVCFLSFEDRLG